MINREKIIKILIAVLMLGLVLIKTFATNKTFINIIWISLFILCLFLKGKNKKTRNEIDKVKIVLILVTMYLIIYVLTGLKVGYQKSPYSLEVSDIIKNLATVFSISIFYEFIRTRMTNNSESWIAFLVISFFFFYIHVEYENFYKTISLVELLEYLLGDFLNIMIESLLLTYLSKNGGYLLNFSYTVPIQLSIILLPVFPNLDWFIIVSLRYILYVLIFIFIRYEDSIRIRKKSRKQIKRENPIKAIPIIILMLLIVSFVAGFLPYKPIAVISNSMNPYFQRGDICIIRKITDYSQIRNIKEGDVIEYQLNDIYILHRVIEVKQSNQGYSYITKGDNNKEQDLLIVNEEQVVGKVEYIVPYLGYPSVWFSEWILNKK